MPPLLRTIPDPAPPGTDLEEPPPVEGPRQRGGQLRSLLTETHSRGAWTLDAVPIASRLLGAQPNFINDHAFGYGLLLALDAAAFCTLAFVPSVRERFPLDSGRDAPHDLFNSHSGRHGRESAVWAAACASRRIGSGIVGR
jgi:hypothetical protein